MSEKSKANNKFLLYLKKVIKKSNKYFKDKKMSKYKKLKVNFSKILL